MRVEAGLFIHSFLSILNDGPPRATDPLSTPPTLGTVKKPSGRELMEFVPNILSMHVHSD